MNPTLLKHIMGVLASVLGALAVAFPDYSAPFMAVSGALTGAAYIPRPGDAKK